MRLFWLWAAPVLAAGTTQAQTLSGPESVEYDVSASRWLVSNRSAGQLLARSGAGTLSLFTDDPVNPAGIEITGGRVFVADGARVRAYRLSDAVREADYAVAGATFLNGMASDGGNRLWVSDFSGQDIHQLDITNVGSVSHVTPLLNVGFTPNGLLWDARSQRLLIVSWGSNAGVYTWRPGESQATLLFQTGFGNFDGVALDCEGVLYVSSWSAQAILRTPPPLTGSSVLTNFIGSQSNPADIHFAPATGEIGIPNAGNSTLTFVPTRCLLGDGFETR